MAQRQSFARRFLKTTTLIMGSAAVGGGITYSRLMQKSSDNSLALNIMTIPSNHRELVASIQNLTQSAQTPDTFVAAADTILTHIRQLKPTIATHHVLRLQAATMVDDYYKNLDTVLSEQQSRDELDLQQYRFIFNRRIADMKLAFDLLDFKKDEVGTDIKRMVQINKMNFARQSRDAHRIRKAYSEILGSDRSETKEIMEQMLQDNPESLDKDIIDIIRETTPEQSLLEPEIMALYTHAPYLGEWQKFIKIGRALEADFDHLQTQQFTHRDGVDYGDLYSLAKEYNIGDTIPIPTLTELQFNTRNLRSIRLKFRGGSVSDSDSNDASDGSSDNSFSSWFGSTNASSPAYEAAASAIEDFKANKADYKPVYTAPKRGSSIGEKILIPPGIRRIGGVQKAMSITSCVRRVQGPVFADGRVLMKGSMIFMAPLNLSNDSKWVEKDQDDLINMDGMFPKDIPFVGVSSFIPVRQTEEWDLRPDVERPHILNGVIRLIREPINDSLASADVNRKYTDSIGKIVIEYDCEIVLHRDIDDYF